jgi:hypothetical protein
MPMTFNSKGVLCSALLTGMFVPACAGPPEPTGQETGAERTVGAFSVACELATPRPRLPAGEALENFTFVWDEVAGATHYRLNVLRASDDQFVDGYPLVVSGITSPATLPVGSYWWNVSAHSDCGRSPASGRVYFDVVGGPPPPPCGQCFPGFNACVRAGCPGTCVRKIGCGSETAHKCRC